jgi:hypothetical protein
MWLSLVGPDLFSAIAVLVLLFGVPVFVVAVLAITSGYIRYDAERRIEAFEAEAESEEVDPKPTVPGDRSGEER